jgi:tellurite methyltransferase
MTPMAENRSIAFFDEQFRRHFTDAALKLNPFEVAALPYLTGDVLDFGCGLGNLAFAAAAQGCKVEALDGSPAAIRHVQDRAATEGLAVSATLADLRDYLPPGKYDCIVSIGLLMFFECQTAFKVLTDLQAHVRPGGLAVVNVLVQGTTYMDMFDPSACCIFSPAELRHRFAGWKVERFDIDEFEAPNNTIKRFATIIARKPDSEPGIEA